MEVNEFKKLLVKKISENNKVKGIAQTGDINAPLVAGQSDIDLFVICQEVPSTDERIEMYKSMGDAASDVQMDVSNGGIWGYGDIFMINGIDVMPMYFTVHEMKDYVEEVLSGKHLNREGSRVLLRKEVLFYHQVLEESIDQMLQALYAANCRYFPSRKRTECDIAAFNLIPNDFIKRLRKIMCDAVNENTIENSVSELKKLGKEMQELT